MSEPKGSDEPTRDDQEDNRARELLERETGGRYPGPWSTRLLFCVALAWSLFQLWIASPYPYDLGFAIVSDTQARSIHLAFAMFLAFLSFPGLLHTGRGFRIAGGLYVVLAAASFLYALALATGTVEGRPAVIFIATGIALLLAAGAALLPSPRFRIPLLDWVLAIAAAFSAAYLYMFFRELAQRPGAPITADLVVSGVGLILLLEAVRRTLGPALVTIAVVFIVYTFAGPYMPDMISHGGASFGRAMSQYWLTAEGVFGIALGVSTSFVFLFVLFGALLDKAGAGNYFIKVAFALLGHLRGGPAKAAVVASAMTGVISGSSIANVVTTGTFTVPLMKRVGFSSEKAGAVEVASSVNGQIMPPVMGAAAFLMVEYVGIPYVQVLKHALLPAVISYIALLYIVHLEAVKADMRGLPKPNPSTALQTLVTTGITLCSVVILAGAVYYGIGWTREVFGPAATPILMVALVAIYVGLLWYGCHYPELELDDPDEPVTALPEAAPTIKVGLHFLLPIVVLIWFLIVERYSPGASAFNACLFLIFILLTQRPITAFFRRTGAYWQAVLQGGSDLLEGLVAGARNMIGIGIATAAAGIVVGTVAMTGIGLVMTEVVETLSGGNLMLMLILTAAISLILGLGLPTTANYIIVATLMAPVVVELGSQHGLVVPLIAVHLFVFYFGIMADVTPPVGLASFAAAAVARGDPIRTGVQAAFYSLRTVALPFLFIFNTQLLLIGVTSLWSFAMVFAISTVAMLVFAAATQGWFFARNRIHETVLLLLVAFTLFRPGFWMDQIYPPYEREPATRIMEIAEATPPGGHLRIQASGLNIDGNEVSKVVMLPMGEQDDGMSRLANAGLYVNVAGDTVRITNAQYGSQADRLGLEIGWTIDEVLVPADRPAREWMFIPALALLGGIVFVQRRRLQREKA
ncbi:TRAP transporter permease [Aquisalimonas lutea]|uniref:TRAP transporter permease n=1 Tax=Aquisalimonas lutea TaxID=1327750 RepID=UPI0025B5690C|nr:TRAP transporter permease [Aquisalimonas lutea]MDN3517049.1 TRAP transporter permease [Aquisalimonas lutea]